MDGAISVIVPTLNAGRQIDTLLTRLEQQTRKPDEIIVVDSSSEDITQEMIKRHLEVKLIVIDRKNFNHGGTRDAMLRESTGDFVLFLTQDAMPSGNDYIAKIVAPFADDEVALVYGRQLPRKDARPAEALVRKYSYGDESMVITKADIPSLGIKAFHSTDVCAAYRRTAYLEVGGFETDVLTNEDMFIAARLLHAGWKIVYEANATVTHSHNFTFRQQYRRNYIQGYEIEKHRPILDSVPLSGEGMALVAYTAKRLLRQGKIIELVRFAIDCSFRLIGNRNGAREARRGAARNRKAA